MFFCMGLAVVGWGLLRSTLFPRWLGIYALILGMAGITAMLVFDARTDLFVAVRWGVSAFFVVAGFLVLKTK